MAKKDKNVISITADTAGKAIKQPGKVLAKGINNPTERDFIILEAQIKDDFCHFKYEIISGVGKGFEHGVKGDGIILDDMRNAFAQFNVHLAFMDDVFKHSDIEILDIDQHHGHELTGLYHVTGFKIKGDGTFDSIVLRGNKYVSGGGRNNETKIHPTQKPVKLYDRLLRDFANDGDKILDTHGGSASIAISMNGMFDGVVCEINKDYYDDACKRFKEQTLQIKMAIT